MTAGKMGMLATLSWLYANKNEVGFSKQQQDFMASKGAAMGDIHQWLAANDNRKRNVVGPLASIHDDHARLDTAGPLAAMHDSLAKSMGLFNKLPEMANPSIEAAVKSLGTTFGADVGKLPGMVAGAIGAAIGAIGAQLRAAIAGIGAGVQVPHGGGTRSTAEEGLSNLIRYQGPRAPPVVSPGVPAGKGRIEAMNMPPVHVHLTHVLDGKVLAKAVTKHQAFASQFPNDMGGPDAHSHYVSPGTPVTDAA